MNWLAKPLGRSWIVCLMLMLSVMSYANTDEPMILIPPPHLQNWGETLSGEKVLYFTESGWIEFSAIVRHEREAACEEAAAVAVKPLLIENAGLKAEVKALRKPRRGTLLWILGAAGAGLVAGVVVGAAVSR